VNTQSIDRHRDTHLFLHGTPRYHTMVVPLSPTKSSLLLQAPLPPPPRPHTPPLSCLPTFPPIFSGLIFSFHSFLCYIAPEYLTLSLYMYMYTMYFFICTRPFVRVYIFIHVYAYTLSRICVFIYNLYRCSQDEKSEWISSGCSNTRSWSRPIGRGVFNKTHSQLK